MFSRSSFRIIACLALVVELARGQQNQTGNLSAQISVNAAQIIRKIPATLYGTNMEWVYNGWGLWIPETNGFDSALLPMVKGLKTSLIRFPGGAYSDFYHWQNGVGSAQNRPDIPMTPNDDGVSPNGFGTDEALALAAATGASLLITVNAATGTPEEAAGWVRYVNGKVHQVTYWEIGNELYMNDGSPASVASTTDPNTYASRYLQFAAAMRAADPTIKIGAIAGENYGAYSVVNYPAWTQTILQKAGQQIDFLAVHNSYAPALGADAGLDVPSVYKAMLAAPTLIRKNLATLSREIDQFAPAYSANIALAVTEWGPFFNTEPQSRFVDHVKTLGSALFVASAMNAFLQTPRLQIANSFKLLDNAFMGWIGTGPNGYQTKAPYMALQLFTNHFGTNLLQTNVQSPVFSSSAIGSESAVSSVPYLDGLSSLSSDGKTLYLMGVNKSFDQDITGSIGVSGFKVAATGTVWTLNGTAIDANTGTTLPFPDSIPWAQQAVYDRFNEGGPTEVTVTQSALSVTGQQFSYNFPAHSISVLALALAH